VPLPSPFLSAQACTRTKHSIFLSQCFFCRISQEQAAVCPYAAPDHRSPLTPVCFLVLWTKALNVTYAHRSRGGGVLSCLVLFIRPALGERPSLGRATALLASCPPPPPSHSHHPKSTWACLLWVVAVQAVTRVSLSFCLGLRLVNAVSLRKQGPLEKRAAAAPACHCCRRLALALLFVACCVGCCSTQRHGSGTQ
jgi:hypothetical protein